MESKIFKIEEVLSAIKGMLLCDIGKVYEVLNFLTSDNLFTHQLPRAGRECAPIVYKQYPWMEGIDLSDINQENWKEKLAAIKGIFSNEISLIPIDGWRQVDPIKESVKMMGGDSNKLIIVNRAG